MHIVAYAYPQFTHSKIQSGLPFLPDIIVIVIASQQCNKYRRCVGQYMGGIGFTWIWFVRRTNVSTWVLYWSSCLDKMTDGFLLITAQHCARRKSTWTNQKSTSQQPQPQPCLLCVSSLIIIIIRNLFCSSKTFVGTDRVGRTILPESSGFGPFLFESGPFQNNSDSGRARVRKKHHNQAHTVTRGSHINDSKYGQKWFMLVPD